MNEGATLVLRTRRRLVTRVALSLALIGTYPASAVAQAPSHVWSQVFGQDSTDTGLSVAVDGSDNVLTTGYFVNTVDFGGGALMTSGSRDVFLVKHDATGAHQWSLALGGAQQDAGFSVAVDDSGSPYLTGTFVDTANFGGADLGSLGLTDIFLAKYDAAGAHVWSQRLGGPGGDAPGEMAVDALGNVIVAGYYDTFADFGGGFLLSQGGEDIFLAKYDPSGVNLWSRGFGGPGPDVGWSVAADDSGNVVMTGYFCDTTDFGGGALVSAGGFDIFLAKYDMAGLHRWSRRFGGSGSDVGLDVAIDGSGNVLVTGYFLGTVDFGGGDLVSSGMTDVFVAKYDRDGVHQWSRSFGSAESDLGSAVAVDGAGAAVVTGKLAGAASFGGDILPYAGDSDIFVAKYDAAGGHEWSQGFGSLTSDTGEGVVTDGSDNVIVTGFFGGAVNFGGGNLINDGFDIFLAKYGPNAATAVVHIPALEGLALAAHPNPFRAGTTLRYSLPGPGHVTIDVFDARGARVATLLDSGRSRGEHALRWDGRSAGRRVGSGVYFVRLALGQDVRTRRLVLLK